MEQGKKSLVSAEYINKIRQELHQYPELAYDLPMTLGIVRRELEAMGLPYTEKYGRSGIVATLNEEKSNFTIGMRADMDALLVPEMTNLPYQSTIPGQAHACGHDIHTAMLLGAAKALTEMKDQIDCRVKFIFQAAEEDTDTGARHMVADGVMDDIDVIIAQHVSPKLETGTCGIRYGKATARCHPFVMHFYGEAAHITTPEKGVDALAMAVRTYSNIETMLAAEIDRRDQYVCGLATIKGGTSFGSVADYAEIEGVSITYRDELDDYIVKRILEIAENIAREMGGRVVVDHEVTCLVVYNDPTVTACLEKSAEKICTPVSIPIDRACEDFSFFQSKKPGVLYWLGTQNEEKGCVGALHGSTTLFDEDAFALGGSIFVQFVLDYMHGIVQE